jgi:predicted aconitase with swiveling domain
MKEEGEVDIRIAGRGVSKGEVQGRVIKSLLPLSLGEDVSLETSEILNKESELYGEPLSGKVLVFPNYKQMEEYPDTLSKLKKSNLQPKALVAESLDSNVVQDAINSFLPAVDMIDISLLDYDDKVIVNGTSGLVELRNVILKNVATSVITHKGKVLLLKRSEDVGTYKGKWACVSGYVEKAKMRTKPHQGRSRRSLVWKVMITIC